MRGLRVTAFQVLGVAVAAFVLGNTVGVIMCALVVLGYRRHREEAK